MLLYLSSTRDIEDTVEALFHFASVVVTVLINYNKKTLEAFLDASNGKID